MRTALYCLAILIPLSGCDSIGRVKSENPVLGPPPPRMPLSKKEKTHEKAMASTSDIRLVHNEESSNSYRGNHVIAMVNGSPVFASEITDLFSGPISQLDMMVSTGKITEERATQERKNLCKQHLDRTIKKHVLLTEMKRNLTTEQQEELDTQLKEGFKAHIEAMKERNNVQTRYELEKKLLEQGIQLADMEYVIMTEELAKFYERSKANEQLAPTVTRAQLIAEYNSRKKDYFVDEKVRWQQISVKYAQQGGKPEALNKMKEIIQKLATGESFETLAREYSNGPTASSGGNWDWMNPESYAESVISDNLKTLPERKISHVIEGKESYHLVRVLKRNQARTISFEEVQEDLKKELIQNRKKEAFEKVYEELRAQADIQTIFDSEIETVSEPREEVKEAVVDDNPIILE